MPNELKVPTTPLTEGNRLSAILQLREILKVTGRLIVRDAGTAGEIDARIFIALSHLDPHDEGQP